MATSEAHRFGQLVGDLLEEIMTPLFQDFCDMRGLYLDRKGTRGKARGGKKVSWGDSYGNSHDLDFVIEKGGTAEVRGKPLAFIETAWRRYTKHSRNKAQEIQGALLPIAEKHRWDKPFLGIILAGVFTEGSLTQLKSSGFEVALFPYDSIVAAFESVGINATFDEDTKESVFRERIRQINGLDPRNRDKLKKELISMNKPLLDQFFKELKTKLDRQIDSIILITLHGRQREFSNLATAIEFVRKYPEAEPGGIDFRKYEIIVRYNNNDKVDASFREKDQAIDFLRYFEQSAKI